MLKLISEPKGITSWDQSRYENMKRAEENLKQNRKSKANDAKNAKMKQMMRDRIEGNNEDNDDPEK